MTRDNSLQPEYSKLAEIYDDIMEDVDYEVWADFIDETIQLHHPDPTSILELACGTGSLALSLDELMCYRILATDKSDHMIQKACQKSKNRESNLRFKQMDFMDIDLDNRFDIILSIFDSINYLHRSKDIQHLLGEVKKVLNPNGLFVFDFTTPRNSIKAIKYLNNEEGYTQNDFRYCRKSRYDAKQQIHYNTFKIEKLDSDQESVLDQYTETHAQRIYTLEEMLNIIDTSSYRVEAKYKEFDLIDADSESLRITMVLTCPEIQS